MESLPDRTTPGQFIFTFSARSWERVDSAPSSSRYWVVTPSVAPARGVLGASTPATWTRTVVYGVNTLITLMLTNHLPSSISMSTLGAVINFPPFNSKLSTLGNYKY